MNKVILTGRLTADPELRQTQGGISSCRFTVAVNRRYKKDKGGYDADFINCQAWRQTAEFISKYFAKGQMIAVEGTLRTGNYQDKKYPDVTHYTTDVLVENAEFCGSKSDNAASNTPHATTQPTATQQTATQQPQSNNSASFGDLSEFEEILSDGDVPF